MTAMAHMLKQAILFIDYDRTTVTERMSYCRRMNDCLGIIGVTINFFSSVLEDLAIISKHRVVSLPTFIALDERGKVSTRLLHIPESEELRDIAVSLAP